MPYTLRKHTHRTHTHTFDEAMTRGGLVGWRQETSANRHHVRIIKSSVVSVRCPSVEERE